MEVRRLIHKMGYRYRLHRRDLPGVPDIVFGKLRKVIFVNGCFWHRRADPQCRLSRLPKSKLDFWRGKLEGNRRRDEENEVRLRALGWKFLIIWECQIKDRTSLKRRITDYLGPRRQTRCDP